MGVEGVAFSQKHPAIIPQLLWPVWWNDVHWNLLLDLERKRAMDPQTLW